MVKYNAHLIMMDQEVGNGTAEAAASSLHAQWWWGWSVCSISITWQFLIFPSACFSATILKLFDGFGRDTVLLKLWHICQEPITIFSKIWQVFLARAYNSYRRLRLVSEAVLPWKGPHSPNTSLSSLVNVLFRRLTHCHGYVMMCPLM